MAQKKLTLPFHIKLRDFQLENYPGSQSPMSYASEVTVIDPKETFDFRIYHEPHLELSKDTNSFNLVTI